MTLVSTIPRYMAQALRHAASMPQAVRLERIQQQLQRVQQMRKVA